METGVRKNTLKLCFQQGSKVPSNLEVLKFVTGTLELGAADLHSVYKDENDGSFYIKLMDEPTFTEYCGRLEELYTFKYDDDSRSPVTLVVASRIFRYVRIFNLPPEIDDKTIAQVLGQFGTIRQHVRERYSPECNLNIFNGVRGVHMEIAKEIPAGLFIGHFRARIYYDGLKNRCFFCKQEGHLKSSCPKLASSSSGSGGSRSYSTVTAQGRPVSTPNLNVPLMTPVMQRLVKAVQEPAPSKEGDKPVANPPGSGQTLPKPATSSTETPAVTEEPQVSSSPDAIPQPALENMEVGEGGDQQGRGSGTGDEGGSGNFNRGKGTGEEGGQQGVKRSAESSSDPETNSNVEPDDNMDGAPFKQVDGGKKKKPKKGKSKPLSAMTTRSLLKSKK